MKIEIELNEENLKERVREATERIETDSWYEIKSSIVSRVSEELIKGLTEKDHWGKDKIVKEVEDKLSEKVESVMKVYVDRELKDYDVEKKVQSYIRSAIKELIETEADKVLSRLMVVDPTYQQEEDN